MRSRAFYQQIKSVKFTLTILWGAMAASVGIYVVVAFLVTRGTEPNELDPTMILIMAAAAVAAGVASFMVPGMMLSNERIRNHMRGGDVDLESLAKNPTTGQVDETRLENLRSLSEVEQRLVSLPQPYMAPFIVGIALAESVAIFGLVLTFLSRQPTYMLPFAGAALTLMVLRFPKLDALFDRAQRLMR